MHFFPLPAEGPDDPTRFVPLLIVLLLAFLVPLLLSRFRSIPIVVGEIVLGMIFGPALLGWVTAGPILDFMSDIGLAFLMFLAGMEINFKMIFSPRNRRGQGLGVLPSSLLLYGATLALAALGAFLAGRIGLVGDPWLLTFVLSATSLGVLLPILKDRELIDTLYGQIIFLTAMLADFITVILLTVHLIVLDNGFDPRIFSLGLLLVAFLAFYKLGPSLVRLPLVKNLIDRLSSATVQIKVRGAITILMAFVVLAEFVNAELILGAFLAGMVISLLKRPEDDGLVHNLEAFGFGFFIPIFFIMVGVNLNLEALLNSPETLLAIPGFFLIALLVKMAPMLVVKRHFTWRELIAAGFLLNTHLSLEVAIAVIGLRTGLFDDATSTAVIFLAILTVLTMPLLFNALAPVLARKETPFQLLLGASDLAIHVAELLRAHGDQVLFVALDPAEKEILSEKGFTNVPLKEGLFAELAERPVQSVLVLSDDGQRNLELVRRAKQDGLQNLIAFMRDPQLLPDFTELGARVFTPALQRPMMISMMARNPDILDLLTMTGDERTSVEVLVRNSEVAGKNLRELKLPGDLLVLAIRRAGTLIIPRGGTAFEMHDRVSMLGNVEDIRAAQGLFEGSSL